MSHAIGSIPSARIDRIQHPHFTQAFPNWQKFRSVFEGGQQFIEEYTEKFSSRETDADFKSRKKISYAPAHAKAAVIDIRNAIFQRMADIVRKSGPQSYQNAIKGLGRGVDLRGSSMDAFIGRSVLGELLVLGRVGVYVDKPSLSVGSTLLNTRATSPYLYTYQAEDIKSWHFNELNMLDTVLLEDHFFGKDEETGLVNSEQTRFRLMSLIPEGVLVRFFAFTGDRQKDVNGPQEIEEQTVLLNLQRIPFVMLQLNHSLLQDVADYQIALLNLASSDMNYSMKSNFPFYTEQQSPQSILPHTRHGGTEGTAAEAQQAKSKAINLGSGGAAQGRGYAKGLDRPGFIHPSSEPLMASMEKQQRLIEEIRQLVNLALSNVKPGRASAESKQIDNQGLEAGLSYIGLELQHAEREIAKIWSNYERSSSIAHISYPDNYQLRTDKDRRQEAKELEELKKGTPSKTYKKIISKEIARVTVGHKVTNEEMEAIEQEIEDAVVVDTDPLTVRSDHEAGFVSTATASEIRGYPKGEAKQAAEDHAKRLALIAAAQSKGSAQERLGARGVPDAGQVNDGADEKRDSRNTDPEPTTADKTRGEGQ